MPTISVSLHHDSEVHNITRYSLLRKFSIHVSYMLSLWWRLEGVLHVYTSIICQINQKMGHVDLEKQHWSGRQYLPPIRSEASFLKTFKLVQSPHASVSHPISDR